MTPLGAALREKFKTPDEAMQTLGLDAALLSASAGALDGDTASGDNLMANRATRRAAASQARGTSRLAEDKKAHDEEVENKKEACDESEEEEKKTEEAEDEEESSEEKRKEDEKRAAEDMVTKSAMDAAIAEARRDNKAAIAAAVAAERKVQRDIRAAEEAVRPHVGNLLAQDSVEGVYRAAFGVLGKDVSKVDASALPVLFAEIASLKSAKANSPFVAMDSAAMSTAEKEYLARFPDARRLSV